MFDSENDDRSCATGDTQDKTDSYAFEAAITYFREGGTRHRWMRLYDLATVYDVAPNDDAKANILMPPASSPHANRNPQTVSALVRPKPPVIPVREPSVQQRYVAGSIAKDVATVIFETFKLRDGRAIGDVRYGELARLETTDLVEAEIVRAIRKRGIAAHDTQVRHLVKPAILNRIIQKAKAKYHVA